MKTNFIYKGKKVIGIRPLSARQYIKTYLPILTWTGAALYVIIKNGICDCLYLTTSTIVPTIAVTIGVFLWTYFVKKDEIRKNYIYK